MSTSTPVKKKAGSAFMKPVTPDATLGAIVGTTPMPRTEITKKIWDYIKKHNLQDPKNKRNINGDEKLTALFGKKTVTMFELTAIVSKHVTA